MKIRLDEFLRPTVIEGATQINPTTAEIRAVNLIKADELPFEGRRDKYELTLELDDEIYKWLANKTSMQTLMETFGGDSESWTGKNIDLWVSDAVISGKPKKIIYARPS